MMRNLKRAGLLAVIAVVTIVGIALWVRTLRTTMRERTAEPLIPADFTKDAGQLRAALEASRETIKAEKARAPSEPALSEEAVRALQYQLEQYEKKE